MFRRLVLLNLRVLNSLLKRRCSGKALHCQHRARSFTHVPATGLVLLLCLTACLDVRLVRNHPVRQAWRPGGPPVIDLPNAVRLKPLPTDDLCAIGLF